MLPARADTETYDDDPFPNLRRAPERRPRLRRWFPALAAIGAIGVFAGVLSYAYVIGGRGADDGAVPVVQADQRPVKVRPDDPGGIAVPFQDKEIYSRLGQGQSEAAPAQAPKAERLLPPPEAPLPRPASAPPPPNPAIPEAPDIKPPSDSVAVVTPPTGKLVAIEPKPEAKSPATGSVAPQASTNAQSSPTTGATAGGSSSPPSASSTTAKARSSASPSPTTSPTQNAANIAAAVTPAAGPAAGFRVQVGSVKSDSQAKREGERLKNQHTDVLGPLQLSVHRADLGTKGVFYRIQLGPLTSADAASDVCKKLSSRKVGCLVVRP